jgi:hypothetical protein
MCASVKRYGIGWAVFVGIQDSASLPKALKALGSTGWRPERVF